ncbi:MerR family transcriptional regulator [Microbacterium sp. ASV49]|uniref:MerR family transcriptional regulator n=1 Tax=Microbacterium candidum TaxID=3041922 RepID=A0ABT7MVI7_9MICO|nr:MerR family transcriptional regulator [Microbacterium sp. ASV49]MDL9978472.1 MerR family transcriptional regulator [Microbacterium sp. ASV49]
MSGERAGMLSIGDFSRYAGLSIRMLRHYDERGLLTPAEVDPSTGYRWYEPAQLWRAGRIRSLRDAGCGIAQIAELLPLFDEPDELKSRLEAHLEALDVEARRLDAQRSLTASLTSAIDERAAPVAVRRREFPGLRVLLLRRTVADYPAEGELWADLRRLLGQPSEVDQSRFGDAIGATYFDEEFRDEDVEMAIWREYAGDLAPRSGFEIASLPVQSVAWATHRGGFDTIGRTTEAIGAWVASRGLTRVGPMFNVYVVGPGREPNPDAWITEVNVPVA